MCSPAQHCKEPMTSSSEESRTGAVRRPRPPSQIEMNWSSSGENANANANWKCKLRDLQHIQYICVSIVKRRGSCLWGWLCVEVAWGLLGPRFTRSGTSDTSHGVNGQLRRLTTVQYLGKYFVPRRDELDSLKRRVHIIMQTQPSRSCLSPESAGSYRREATASSRRNREIFLMRRSQLCWWLSVSTACAGPGQSGDCLRQRC